ncbi:MAG: 50S ribosomal protein L11 methyltransferase [Oscillospiraceae bacterium]|nr:50S ribosomal protein L11 methyltransferase [Oscillospiraceae bacterium]
MTWTQITTTCSPPDVDTVCAVMSMIDTQLVIHDNSDIAQHIRPEWGEVLDEDFARRTDATVSLFLPEDWELGSTIAYLEARFSELGLAVAVTHDSVNQADWADEWKKFFQPTRIGERLMIVPSWEEEFAPAEGDVVVRIDPGMAFGTGTHESTRLALLLLERHMQVGMDMLDIGTGSGILAIAAAKLGAGRVVGCDIDPQAVKAAAGNARANGESGIHFTTADLTEGTQGQFGLVCANIVADILIRLAPDLPRYVLPGGRVIFSGIIAEREGEVTAAMTAQGFRLADRAEENAWVGLVFEKGGV